MKAIFSTLFVVGVLTATVSADSKPGEKFEVSEEEKTILDLTNQERARQKLPPLKFHPLLMRAARDHTNNMAKQSKLDHTLDGKGPLERTKALGYGSGWIGENIAAGDAFLPKDAFKIWMNSKPHRENMLNPTYAYIGIGAARSSGGEYYYTQVFGRAPSP
jgi:uncharacterized protein YkwD